MDEKALAAAKDKLRLAKAKLDAMQAATHLNELADCWSDFLTEVQRVYTRLIKATEHGSSKGWSDQVKHARKTDELLSYVHHARNADEHGSAASPNASRRHSALATQVRMFMLGDSSCGAGRSRWTSLKAR